ncbi:hypothetical protein, partial [Endozoicomonas sp. ALB122]|uniref:hypothetical protein n=1 Tax=Endozoicomonas sp. ALB122 TaxID=3403075 RepID=UPI003BB49DDB
MTRMKPGMTRMKPAMTGVNAFPRRREFCDTHWTVGTSQKNIADYILYWLAEPEFSTRTRLEKVYTCVNL